MRHRLSSDLAVTVLLAVAASAAGAQVYKWTDEKGGVNYSNNPPADARRKGVSVVEDRVSVYTADPAVLEATQNARERRNVTPPPAPVDRRPAVTSIAPPPAVSTYSDPCVDGSLDCYGYYGGVPVIGGRRRPPRLNQPELPPGAIAGNVNAGGGFTPGLSTQAPLGAPAPRVERPRVQIAPAREPDRR
jgi:hypothetical protein